MTDVVVLGWDGLDAELIDEFGLGESFGDHQTTIETFANPVIDEPHTLELWPSMITGKPPAEHGIHAVTEGKGVEWDNALLNTAATVGQSVLPHDWLTWIGAQLLDHGFGKTGITPAVYYKERDIETVFDACGGRAISIPNYGTVRDREHGLDAHRNQLWQSLDITRNGEHKKPGVAIPEVYAVLGSAAGRRLGHTLEAIAVDEPLVWTWFGLLDTVGHLQPALGDEFVADWYQTAAQITEQVRAATSEETTVIAVSDHGIQDGDHTHYATLCADEQEPVEQVDHVFGLADWLREQEFAASIESYAISADDRTAVKEDLEALGYIKS